MLERGRDGTGRDGGAGRFLDLVAEDVGGGGLWLWLGEWGGAWSWCALLGGGGEGGIEAWGVLGVEIRSAHFCILHCYYSGLRIRYSSTSQQINIMLIRVGGNNSPACSAYATSSLSHLSVCFLQS